MSVNVRSMSEPKPWLVMKFGGTSVASVERWGRIIELVQSALPRYRVGVIVSALSQVSNLLERAIREAVSASPASALAEIQQKHRDLVQGLNLDSDAGAEVERRLTELGRLLDGIALTGEASPRLQARIMSIGELTSSRIGFATLRQAGVQAVWQDAREILETQERPEDPAESRYLEAEVRPRTDPQLVESKVGRADCFISQGFIARRPGGETALLGRGGSDTSAALFGAALGAERVEIWTDVHGMFTADPRHLPAARLIRQIGYREARELAAMGAKVLHPRALGPCHWAKIPLAIRHTQFPDAPGTVVSDDPAAGDAGPAVMAVVKRTGVTLMTIETLDMWGTHGFLARVFHPFMDLGISVDLVATSQAAVSITLDRLPGGIDGERFRLLLARLSELGEVHTVHPTAVVSIVGRRIRTVLHELGPAFQVFREHAIHLVSESSEDLNFSFVVDESDADKLVGQLHARLVPAQGSEGLFGASWARLMDEEQMSAASIGPRWWRERKEKLLSLAQDGRPRFVYDLSTVRERARGLRSGVPSLGQLFYAMKANHHPAILRTIYAEGFGIECVSAREVAHVRTHLGPNVPILFTPNFCPLDEYGVAFEADAEVTVDGPHLLSQAPEIFRGRSVALRLDPGEGRGHHEKVKTAGAHAKFGQPLGDAEAFARKAKELGIRVTGLHAHVGSGILEPEAWARTGRMLAEVEELFPDLKWLNVGGGLGVVELPGQSPLHLPSVEAGLSRLKASMPRPLELRMEPGRYLVSEAGVLIGMVTQVRNKGEVRFVGMTTGMNSLIRPALYGAWHAIHNLSRLDEPAEGYAHVVGPICETGDILGRDRLLPRTETCDVLLIENCGAYGRVMSSSYNMRPPAEEVILP